MCWQITFSGGVYHGEVLDGKRHGQGTFTFTSGKVYEGQWKEGKQHGQGKRTYANGAVYKGQWKEGKRHGQGKYTFAKGTVKEGIWHQGKFVEGSEEDKSSDEDSEEDESSPPSTSDMPSDSNADADAASTGTAHGPATVGKASTGTAHGPATVGKQLKRKRTTSERKAGKQKALDKKDGFVDMPRSHDRSLNGSRILSDGNVRSCGQDGLVMGCKALGVPITKKKVYDATLPAEGDTKVGVIVNYADTIGVEMLDARVPSTLGYSIFQQDGGPEHALLQIEDGVFWVELRISQTGKKDDKHVVMYDASFTVPEGKNTIAYQPIIDAGFTPDTFDLIRGVVRDNDKDTSSKYLDPSDREFAEKDGKPWPKARDVFKSLFPLASKVQVVGVWLMRKKAAVGVAVV